MEGMNFDIIQVNKQVKMAFIISMIVLGTGGILYIIGCFLLPQVILQYQQYISMIAYFLFILLIVLPLVYLNHAFTIKYKKPEKTVLSWVSVFIIIAIFAVTCFEALTFNNEYSYGDGKNQKIERVSIGFLDSKVEYFTPVTPFFMRKTGEINYKGSYYKRDLS